MSTLSITGVLKKTQFYARQIAHGFFKHSVCNCGELQWFLESTIHLFIGKPITSILQKVFASLVLHLLLILALYILMDFRQL